MLLWGQDIRRMERMKKSWLDEKALSVELNLQLSSTWENELNDYL